MFITSQNIPKKKSKFPFIFITLYIIVIFIIENFYRESLFNISKDIIKKIQIYQSENIIKFLYPISKIFSFLGNVVPFGIIILLFYNFGNIYKTFTLLSSLFLSSLFVGGLKMIYMEPRPYFDFNDEINPVDNEAGWGNPSGHAVFNVAFYLTFWELLFQNSKLRKKTFVRYFTLCLILIFVCFIIISRLILAAHTLNQLIFGATIGFGIYYFLFYAMRIETNNPDQLLRFIKTRNLIYSFVNIVFIVLGVLLYFVEEDEKKENNYENIINKKFNDNNLKLPPEARRMQKDGLVTMIIFFCNYSVFMGIKFELFFSFKGNVKDWKNYNFNLKLEEDDETMITSLSSINNITQWNHTNTVLSLIRLIIISLVLLLINIPFHFIKWDSNFIIIVIFKVLFPVGNNCFFLFFILKRLLKLIGLTNRALFDRMIENPL